jgi:hypothetical protein
MGLGSGRSIAGFPQIRSAGRALPRTESTAVIATMKTWLWTQATLKTLSIGKAAAYVVANGDRLTRFLGAAVSYTLLETAKLVGVDPVQYLRDAALADGRGQVLLPGGDDSVTAA